MTVCDKCNRIIDDGQKAKSDSEVLCDDCYIENILSEVRKVYYENSPDEFMQRLQHSFSVNPQRYH